VRANISKGAQVAQRLVESLPVHLRGPEREFRFHATRKWRFDLCWPWLMLAVEIEGGAFVVGAHTRGAHFRSDCEKYAEALALGWRVLRVMPEQVRSGQAAEWVRRLAESAEQAAQ